MMKNKMIKTIPLMFFALALIVGCGAVKPTVSDNEGLNVSDDKIKTYEIETEETKLEETKSEEIKSNEEKSDVLSDEGLPEKVVVEENVIPENIVVEIKDYNDIINYFRNYKTDRSLEMKNKVLNSDGMWEAITFNGSVMYCLRDITGDGKDELIFATKETYKGFEVKRILAVYSMNNDEPVLSLDGWSRKRVYLLNNNGFYIEGSNGAAYSSWEIGRLNAYGTEYTLEKYVYSDSSSGEAKIYINTTGDWSGKKEDLTTLTSEDFQAMAEAYAKDFQVLEMMEFIQ